MPFLETSEII
uniref:Uncharacterized protein n=1 Tax=Anguilla anguilla TaxID=7936 RepID=A0A0E9S065_ANGAN